MADVATDTGLSTQEARSLLAKYGPNIIEEKRRPLAARIVKLVATPMSLMFFAAGGLSFWANKLEDVYIIAVLFATNVGVSAWHEAKADNAIEKLRDKLSILVKTKRDGRWAKLPASDLVPGDIVELAAGDIIPADVTLASTRNVSVNESVVTDTFRVDASVTRNVSVNESVVTGESLPKEKRAGDASYSGAFVTTGLAEAAVTATGKRTYFGKTISLIEPARGRSKLEKDIMSVSEQLSIASIVIMLALTAVLAISKAPILDIATLDVSLLIAGIPVALPTVMTLIISVGVVELTKRSAIVRRLSSLEDLADVDLLLSDKTGTLTENRIAVVDVVLIDSGMPLSEAWSLALAASPREDANPLDAAVRAKARELSMQAATAVDFIPGDSDRKRTTAFVEKDGRKIAVDFGAPQTIRDLCAIEGSAGTRFDEAVSRAASKGYRALALAVSADDREAGMKPIAVFFLADAIRKDALETVGFMRRHGIAVKMVTGDGYDVATHVATELGLKGRIVRRAELEADRAAVASSFASIGGFAEVMPKDKYDLVNMAKSGAAGRPYVVASTGDGVNDVPAVKVANVGIAVANAVDALKGAADIVLTKSGISVIRDAIVEARKIFVRLYNYSVYRMSESFRLIVTVAVIGIMFKAFPLTPIQIILIALLNDLPIITMAFDRVAVPQQPASVDVRKRIKLSFLFGSAGIANSLLMLWIAISVLHAPWEIIQTIFFLKLTVSGHMLIYVAHTEKRWYSFLPSKQIIWATSLTQAVATALALTGTFVTRISWQYVVFIWIWAFFWMQVSELLKHAHIRIHRA